MIVSVLVAVGFSAVLAALSFIAYGRWLGPAGPLRLYDLALTTSTVFLLAILGESLVNPVYQALVGEKLWVYRILPLHDHNVSALAVVIWPAYGMHIYFIQRALDHRLPARLRTPLVKAILLGLEAPLVWEIAGNLVFLAAIDQYYAYYNPSDLWHLTSIQVVPIYIVAILVGLVILTALRRMGRHWLLPPVLFVAALGYLFAW